MDKTKRRVLPILPCLFFLCGYLKDRVYRTVPTNIEELKQNFRVEIVQIDSALTQNAMDAFHYRLSHCKVNGDQFETYFDRITVL